MIDIRTYDWYSARNIDYITKYAMIRDAVEASMWSEMENGRMEHRDTYVRIVISPL